MAPKGHELVIGMLNDPTFGPVIMLGYGGTTVELFGDVVHSPAPVDAAEATRMLLSLQSAPLLTGFRGSAPIELAPFAELVARVSDAALAYRGRIAEMEFNPVILHGQTHGGIAQGVGQALLEQCTFDMGTGQNLSASFMDYAIPKASHLPSFTTALSEVPAASHPLGFRPGSEGGTTPALAVTTNAILDALEQFGVRHIEMPATPARIWPAIQEARRLNPSFEPDNSTRVAPGRPD